MRKVCLVLMTALLALVSCQKNAGWNPSNPPAPPKPGGEVAAHKGPKAVFIGDSITWLWVQSIDINKSKFDPSITLPNPLPSYIQDKGTQYHVTWHPGFFTDNGYANAGVSGNTTVQMLARYQKEVLDKDPYCVVIMGGTNDLAQGYTKDAILNNLSAMAERAAAKKMKVVMCSVTPCNDRYSKLNPKEKGTHIVALNKMIKDYAASKGFVYCDYYPALVAEDGYALKEEYCLYDRLHPNPDAYYLLEGIIKPILDDLLK